MEFIKKRSYTNAQISAELRFQTQGGIRYSGTALDPKTIAIFLTTTPWAIYRDEVVAETIHYSGEGQRGDQKLRRGNRALLTCFLNERNVHVFKSNRSNNYQYLGTFVVANIEARAAPDATGRIRGVFSFGLRGVSETRSGKNASVVL